MKAPKVLPEMEWADVDKAAGEFRYRWTLRALRRVDAELHERLLVQLGYYQEAFFKGETENIKIQGEALCRGWRAAVAAMEAAQEPSDAYMIGQHGGMLVAIGRAQQGHARVRDLHDGRRVVWLTPDEVAQLYAGLQAIGKVQELWPDARVVRVVEKYPDEPAKDD